MTTPTDSGIRAAEGRIFEIQRFSIHDGPGIRTTVFMKGCPLSCRWCHNPESIAPGPILSFLPEKCIGCGYCFKACPNGAHRMEDGVHILDRALCTACGLCAAECHAGALELVGKTVTSGEVLDEVVRDRPFYETSEGGMTLSGGEPTLQIDFTHALLQGAKAEGLHCAVETCGLCQWERLERILPLTDLFLFDFKDSDPDKHRDFVDAPAEPILDNLKRLHDTGASILLRCPLVPGFNDRADHFDGIARLTRDLPDLLGAEVMAYHRLGESKMTRFGLDPARRPDVEAPDTETVRGWIEAIRARGGRVVNETPGESE